MRRLALVFAGVSALFAGCGGGDSTTTIIQTVETETAPETTTTPPATTPAKPPPSPADEGFTIPNPTTNDYRQPLSVWPSYSDETQAELADIFLANNPTDCAALREIEDAVIGVRDFVDKAANDPRVQDEPISNAMLVYCQDYGG